MEKKNHKGGYAILKEKIASLEKQLETKVAQITELQAKVEANKQLQAEAEKAKKDLAKAEAERDSWHNKYKSEHDFHVEAAEKRREAVSRLEFLIDHCPFWVRWMYKHEFK